MECWLDHFDHVDLVEVQSCRGTWFPLARIWTRRSVQGLKCFLLIKQIAEVFMHAQVTTKALAARIRKQSDSNRHPVKHLGLLPRAALHEHGLVEMQGTAPLACSVYCMKEALKSLHAGEQAISRLDSAVCVAVDAFAVSAAAPGLQLQRVLPKLLPASVPGPRAKHTSLRAIAPGLVADADFSTELHAFKEHCLTDIVIGREGGMVSSSTWGDYEGHVMLFLGYIHQYLNVPKPSLKHYAQADLVAKYVRSRIAVGNSGHTLMFGLAVAKRVVLFLESQAYAVGLSPQIKELHAWLGGLQAQVQASYPPRKRKVDELAQHNKWVSSAELVLLLSSQKAAIEAECTDVAVLAPAQACELMDVALACTLFGWIPPMRSSVVRTLFSPHSCDRCQDPDCRVKPLCRGNRLVLLPSGSMKFYIPHHKNQQRWGAIEFELPEDLTALLKLYIDKSLPALQSRHNAIDKHAWLFPAPDGQAFTKPSFNRHWLELMNRWGGPDMSPHSLRSVFVTERRRVDRVPGPEDATAAYVMGNTTGVWQRYYDMQVPQTTMQKGIKAMAEWRTALLNGINQQLC